MSESGRKDRVLDVVSRVLRQAVRDAGRAGIALVDDQSPEAGLAAECCHCAVGVEHTWLAAAADIPAIVASRRALAAHPANKTALLLGRSFPSEPLLPLGDLYASQVAALAGGWSVPPDVARLIELAGGVHEADGALRAWLDEWRQPGVALDQLPPNAR